MSAPSHTHIGVDVGGSLCKVAVLGCDPNLLPQRERWKSLRHVSGEQVLLRRLPTSPEGIDLLVKGLHAIAKRGKVTIGLTGGGVHKHRKLLESLYTTPGICMKRTDDEFGCLAQGIFFTTRECVSPGLFHIADFHFHGDVGSARARVKAAPFNMQHGTAVLVVNIGTGTSFVDIDSNGVLKRVGGSSLGGGTFLGLCRGLAKCTSFKQAVSLAAEGDSRKVDMLVGDIFGSGEEAAAHGLRGSVLASSFAKLAHCENSSGADRALSTLVMIAMNLAAMAQLHAEICKRRIILFTGTFLQDNPMALKTMAYAIHFWSQGSLQAVFIESSAFLCSLGALANVLEEVPQPAPAVLPAKL